MTRSGSIHPMAPDTPIPISADLKLFANVRLDNTTVLLPQHVSPFIRHIDAMIPPHGL